MEVLTLAVMAASNILCFVVGAKVGQKVAKGEEVELPNVNPKKSILEHQAKRIAEMEQSKIDTIMRNIESYDGTANGQKDVPRG